MTKLSEHLIESSLIGRRNSTIPKKEVAEAIELAMENVMWELEGINATEAISVNHKKQIAKTIILLRKLGDDISKDIKGRKK